MPCGVVFLVTDGNSSGLYIYFLYVVEIVGTAKRNRLISTLTKEVLEGAEAKGHQIDLINSYYYNLN